VVCDFGLGAKVLECWVEDGLVDDFLDAVGIGDVGFEGVDEVVEEFEAEGVIEDDFVAHGSFVLGVGEEAEVFPWFELSGEGADDTEVGVDGFAVWEFEGEFVEVGDLVGFEFGGDEKFGF